MSQPLASLGVMLIGLDLDGVLCDLGPGIAARITDRFGVATHPASWRSYDLRLLRLGLPEARLSALLDEVFADPEVYRSAVPVPGAVAGVAELRAAGWKAVGITARPPHLAAVTLGWLADQGLEIDEVHHTAVGAKAAVAAGLGVDATVEDNPAEAELLAGVCQSWLLDHPYNRDATLVAARRLGSWDELVGNLCQLRLFA